MLRRILWPRTRTPVRRWAGFPTNVTSKVGHGKFWNGLEAQLPSYLTSDQSIEGWYVALRYRNNPASEARMLELPRRVRAAATSSNKILHYAALNVRPKESASNI